MKLKEGDKVVVVDAKLCDLESGGIYTIREVDEDGFFTLEEREDWRHYHFARFRLASSLIKELL